jgi:ABC-2 type transport system permease protein
MTAFTNHFSFEFRTGIRNRTLLMMNYLFPLGFFLMMGFVMPEINPDFQAIIIPSMVVFAILAATLLGLPDPLVNARDTGIFRSYRINGVPSTSILFIPALTTMLHLVIVTAIIVVTAPLLFDAPTPVNWLNFILVFLALSFACAGLGVLIGVISPNSRTTVLFSQLIFIPSMLLGGLMLPYSMLPDVAGRISQLLPATQAMNAFNGLAMGQEADFSPTGSLLLLLLSGALAFALANYLFSWDSRNTTRQGHPALALIAFLPYAIGLFLLVPAAS